MKISRIIKLLIIFIINTIFGLIDLYDLSINHLKLIRNKWDWKVSFNI